ncbi:ATP-binding protein [Aliiglaciecola sp. LCG003]|uniref:ATP-binding protein n=1 Tax=Aliiglaciecola sp. LCG003 TaxID=3053655 RepID=UPI0025734DCF|nr:ATP-binding protein [Aliiglaciecola sp. LCG003]WJG09806.1 ATP-binding protein [Aliiglaciecola sp. LCG003]
MKRIYLSVLFTVVGSLILIGWILDLIADKSYNAQPLIELELYEKIVRGAASQLASVDEPELSLSVATLADQFALQFRLEPLANLALPQELDKELTQSGKLMLQSNDSSFLFVSIPKHPRYLLRLTVEQLGAERQNLDFMLTLALYVGVGISLALWLVPLTSRLSLLTNTAAKFGEGRLEERISPSKWSYIRDLELNFNRMAAQIETLVADNKLLAESLSHDLRTPVACLRFGIEAALDTNDQSKREQYILRVEDELTRLESMLEAFLSYASMERKAQNLQLEEVEIGQLVRQSVNEIAPLALQKSIQLEYDIEFKTKKLKLDGHWVHRAVTNLLSNALSYAEDQILVHCNCTNQQLAIAIHDNGPGVPFDKWDTIFTPFVTVESSRNRQTNSFGLGLAIVSRVMHWHQGHVTITRSNKLGGACFTLIFPIQQ